MIYLFDTNIVIYYFNGLTADQGLHQTLAESFNISVITRIEFLGWSEFVSDPRLYNQAQIFFGSCPSVRSFRRDRGTNHSTATAIQDQDPRCHHRRDRTGQRPDRRDP